MRREKLRGGFTLVEIMIVLAILVLLIAIVGPRVIGTQDKADIKITVTQIGNLQQALDFYKIDNRAYPSTEEGLKALVEKPADENRSRNWDGKYLDELPADPWGSPYRYEFPGTRGGSPDTPNIWSLGPDGKDNSEDDITSWKKSESTDGKGNEAQDQAERVALNE